MGFRLKYGQWEVPLVPNPEFVVGRSRSADLRLNEPSISRKHAAFKIEDGQVYVRDNESRNGVFVDGERTRGWAKVSVGAQVVIGAQAVRLVRDTRVIEEDGEFVTEESQLTHLADPRKKKKTASAEGPVAELSPRERQVVSMIARGFTQREASEALEISIKTVETYLRRIREKVGAKSRAELADFARAAGIVRDTGPESDQPKG